MNQITVYTLKTCPNCEKLKAELNRLGIQFQEQDLETKESIIELRYHACYPKEAPVLQCGRTCYETKAIFLPSGEINQHVIHAISGKVP